jgi:hypothetical protein
MAFLNTLVAIIVMFLIMPLVPDKDSRGFVCLAIGIGSAVSYALGLAYAALSRE